MIRPTAHFLVNFVAAIVAAIAVVFVGVAWRLSSGPISLAVLTPYVQEALAQTDSPYRIDFSETILIWSGWAKPLGIRLIDVRAVGPDGLVVATAPKIGIALSIQAMWRGIIAPTALEIIQPTVRLVRDKDGAFQLGLGEASEVTTSPGEFLLADLLAPPDRDKAMGYLTRVSIVRGDLTIDDREIGTAWHAPNATLHLRRDGRGISATALLSVALAGRLVDVDLRGRYSTDDGSLNLRASFADLHPEWLVDAAPVLAPLAAGRFPLSGVVEVAFAANVDPTDITFDLRAGAGSLALPDWLDTEVAVAGGHIKGRVDLAESRLTIEEMSVDLGGPMLVVSGTVAGSAEAPNIAISAVVTDLPVDGASQYWPETAKPLTRKWMVENLSSGTIRKAEATIKITPDDLKRDRLPADAIVLAIEADGVTVDYLSPLPKATNVSGFSTLTPRSFTMRVWGGELYGLTVGEASIVMTDLDLPDSRAVIDVRVTGPVEDALKVLAHPYLGYPQKLGIDPAAVTGTVSSELHVDFPLYRGLQLHEVAISAHAELSDVGIGEAFGDLALSDGMVVLDVDVNGMDVVGTMALGGVPGSATWRENFNDDGDFRRRYTFSGRFTDEQRRVLGFPGEDYVTGPTETDIEIVGLADGSLHWRIAANLRDATMQIPEIKWRKPSGVDGIVEISMSTAEGQPTVLESFDLLAGDLVANGSVDLDPESGSIRRIKLDRLDVGETSVQASIGFLADGGFDIEVVGDSVDLRPFLEDGDEQADDTATDAASRSFTLTAQVSRLIVSDTRTLSNATATFSMVDDRWESLESSGSLANGARLSLTIDRGEDGRIMRIASADAGAVLRAFEIYDDAVGGSLVLVVALDVESREDTVFGKLVIEDFHVVNAPGLAKVLAVASVTGMGDVLNGDGIPFTKLVAPFRKTGDIVSIKNGRAYGPAIGFTYQGDIDLDSDTANIDGTLIPAYTLNSILGKIPVIGDILVGPKGGGIFAVTYRLSGPLADPEVVVNPLSVLAPGIIRDLFKPDSGGTDETAGEDQGDASR